MTVNLHKSWQRNNEISMRGSWINLWRVFFNSYVIRNSLYLDRLFENMNQFVRGFHINQFYYIYSYLRSIKRIMRRLMLSLSDSVIFSCVLSCRFIYSVCKWMLSLHFSYHAIFCLISIKKLNTESNQIFLCPYECWTMDMYNTLVQMR